MDEHELLRELGRRVARLERLAVLRAENNPTLDDYGEPFDHDTLGHRGEEKTHARRD